MLCRLALLTPGNARDDIGGIESYCEKQQRCKYVIL